MSDCRRSHVASLRAFSLAACAAAAARAARACKGEGFKLQVLTRSTSTRATWAEESHFYDHNADGFLPEVERSVVKELHNKLNHVKYVASCSEGDHTSRKEMVRDRRGW